MHFRIVFTKQVLRAEIFGLSKCCMKPFPPKVPSTLLQRITLAASQGPQQPWAMATSPVLAKLGGNAAMLFSQLIQAIRMVEPEIGSDLFSSLSLKVVYKDIFKLL